MHAQMINSALNHFVELPDAEPELPEVARTVELSHFERKTLEESCLLNGLTTVLRPKMSCDRDAARLRYLIRDAFPSSVRPGSGDIDSYPPALVNALEEQMKQENLQPQHDFVAKVIKWNTRVCMVICNFVRR